MLSALENRSFRVKFYVWPLSHVSFVPTNLHCRIIFGWIAILSKLRILVLRGVLAGLHKLTYQKGRIEGHVGLISTKWSHNRVLFYLLWTPYCLLTMSVLAPGISKSGVRKFLFPYFHLNPIIVLGTGASKCSPWNLT